MNTKKINAGIAFLCLQNMDDQRAIPEDRVFQITNLADQSESTELYIEGTNNLEIIDQCIALIQEYLRSVLTDINIGDRVEVLEDNPEESVGSYYDKGEKGVVVRMLEESCIVDFSEYTSGTAEIPFSSLKKVQD